jgi:hypothetical protein
MARNTRTYALIILLLLSVGVVAVPVAGQENPGETPSPGNNHQDSGDGGSVAVSVEDGEEAESDDEGITEAIEKLIETLQDFTGTWDTTLEELLIAVLFRPFHVLAQQLVRQVTLVLTNTPSVYPNPAVEEIHREVLLVTYMLSGVGFSGIGLLYMTGPLFGVSYSQVRKLIPRLIIALAFASASLPLLQLTVEGTDAVVQAFAPSGLQLSNGELLGLSAGLVLVWVINAVMLLGVVALFLVRAVYILFIAAISPLLAFMWVFPQTKRYADTFIAGYWTALAMAPLDVLVLRFSLALMEGNGATAFQSVSNWIFGVASLVLLLWLPYQLFGASQAAVGRAYSLADGVKQRVKEHRKSGQPPGRDVMKGRNSRRQSVRYRGDGD